MRKLLRSLSSLVALLVAPTSYVLASGESRAEMPTQSGGAFAVPVNSIKDLRFRNTLHQQYDFSCGSAAVATLLTYHYAYPVNEQQVFREMFEHGDQAKIRREGFSLLDMKNYLEAHGFVGDGFVAEIEQLLAAGIPAIALIQEHGYHHFIVVKGLRNGRVLVGDPSAGTRAMTYRDFQGIWVNHILFVIHNRLEQAKFNAEADWGGAPRAPLGDSVYRTATEMVLPKRGPADY